MTPEVNYDEYQEVINGPKTFAAIADHLKHAGSAIIGWNDGESTHYDILFTLRPVQAGSLQGGVRGQNDLFVSIMRVGAFGFEPGRHDTAAGYYAEKLTLGTGPNVTTEKLAELVNGIRGKL